MFAFMKRLPEKYRDPVGINILVGTAFLLPRTFYAAAGWKTVLFPGYIAMLPESLLLLGSVWLMFRTKEVFQLTGAIIALGVWLTISFAGVVGFAINTTRLPHSSPVIAILAFFLARRHYKVAMNKV